MEFNITFPCKMYKLGDTPITVSAEVDAERFKRQGWTFTPQKYEYQDLPRVLYHPVQGNKIVTTQSELDEAIKEGWFRSPFTDSETVSLRKQIEWHTAQAVRLRVRLQEINPSEVDEPADDEPNPEAELISEPVSTPQIEPQPTSTPQPQAIKKRGRKPGKKALKAV